MSDAKKAGAARESNMQQAHKVTRKAKSWECKTPSEVMQRINTLFRLGLDTCHSHLERLGHRLFRSILWL